MGNAGNFLGQHLSLTHTSTAARPFPLLLGPQAGPLQAGRPAASARWALLGVRPGAAGPRGPGRQGRRLVILPLQRGAPVGFKTSGGVGVSVPPWPCRPGGRCPLKGEGLRWAGRAPPTGAGAAAAARGPRAVWSARTPGPGPGALPGHGPGAPAGPTRGSSQRRLGPPRSGVPWARALQSPRPRFRAGPQPEISTQSAVSSSSGISPTRQNWDTLAK